MNFSNIIHKVAMRIANLEQVIPGFREANRKRLFFTIQANNTAVVEWVAPYRGYIENMVISSPTAATTSSSGNSVTLTVTDVTASKAILVKDTFTDSFDFLQN